ncbi:MAG: nucleotide exchange factor GrpE [Candidatus Lokiarchaeota archaeon]|nr:nucleotide exchange factor GrpE [Candidatus Lokiarchaeota archaeon]
MTRKKKDKEKMNNESIKKEEAESLNNEISESIDRKSHDSKGEKEEQEIKLLEGGEQKVLEYHDLDDLISKYNTLKKSNNKDKELLTKHQKESESWKSKHMRLQAEFENAQKRWNKNRQNLRKEYIGYTLRSFLPLYDSFKKALDGEDENNAILKQFYDQFIGILKFHNAEPIKVKENDPFDYSNHEALSSLERDDLPNNSIIEIIQDGWKMDKDVLRFAKVIISREPAPPEPEPEPEVEAEAEINEEITQEDKKSEIDSNENEKETQEETKEAEKELAEPEEKNK